MKSPILRPLQSAPEFAIVDAIHIVSSSLPSIFVAQHDLVLAFSKKSWLHFVLSVTTKQMH